jgi:hypothetical protein
MSYVVSGLPLAEFQPLFGLSDEVLAARGMLRVVAGEDGRYPCRILLEDASPGQSLLLLNYEHQPVAGPYRSRHAVFVNEAASEERTYRDRMPDILAGRKLISLRAYDETGMMIDGDIVSGSQVEARAVDMLAVPQTAYVHAHNPGRGCFAARIDRG